MAKGKLGINLTALAILAFVLCFFGFLEVLILLVAYALLIEKDAWLTRQTFQALYLRIAYAVATTVLGWFFTILNTFFGWFRWYNGASAMASAHDFLNILLSIGLFILAAIAVLRLLKNKDAGLPLINHLADYTMGLVESPVPSQVKPADAQSPVQPAYQAPVLSQAKPVYQTPPQAPAQPAYQPPVQPVYQTPAQPVAPPPAPAPAAEVIPAVPEPAAAVEEAAPVAAVAPEGVPTADLSPAQTVVESAAATEPAAEKPPAAAASASGYWICSCGRENFGNFCMSCGNPRKM
jgi:hypothetical protein